MHVLCNITTTPKLQVRWNILRIDITQELSWCWHGKVCFREMHDAELCRQLWKMLPTFAAIASILIRQPRLTSR